MTESEICREYRGAKYKGQQVEILAQLNRLEEGQVVDILLRGGEKIRYFPFPRGKRIRRELSDGEYCRILTKRLEELERKLKEVEKEYSLIAKIMKTYPVGEEKREESESSHEVPRE